MASGRGPHCVGNREPQPFLCGEQRLARAWRGRSCRGLEGHRWAQLSCWWWPQGDVASPCCTPPTQGGWVSAPEASRVNSALASCPGGRLPRGTPGQGHLLPFLFPGLRDFPGGRQP